jgi:hypothetical protein
MKRTLTGAICLLFVALAGQLASAAVIEGQFVPDALVGKVGTQYRLVFTTSGVITATSPDPAVYDNFLAQQVQNTMLGSFNYGWKAVVSTADTAGITPRVAASIVSDANYGVNPNEDYAGVFNSAGFKVASTGNAMLSSGFGVTLLNPVNYDQTGALVSSGSAWTGSYSDGTPWFTVPPARVGENGETAYGTPGSTNANWISAGHMTNGYGNTAHIYGMSNVLTVPVPEPATIVLWSVCTGVVGLVALRKRRRSK